jgi:hypothetical protein
MLLRKGAKALSDQELLAVLLGRGTPGMDVLALAAKLARAIDENRLPRILDVRPDLASDPGKHRYRLPRCGTGCCLPGGQTRRHSPTLSRVRSSP